jgi:hypothetical protein
VPFFQEISSPNPETLRQDGQKTWRRKIIKHISL